MEQILNILNTDTVYILILMMTRLTVVLSGLFFFTNPAIQVRQKMALVLLLTIFAMPLVVSKEMLLLVKNTSFFVLFINEVILGLVITLMINMVLYSYKTFGELLSFSAGLSMAQIFDVSTSQQEQVFSKLFYILVIFVFINSGFFDLLIVAYIKSYQYMPVGFNIIGKIDILTLTAEAYSKVFGVIFVATMPFFFLTTVVDLYFGYITRNSPAFNIFAVSFQVKIILVLVALVWSVNGIADIFSELLLDLGGSL